MSLDDIVKQKKSSKVDNKRGSSGRRRGGFRKQRGESKPIEYVKSMIELKRSSTSSFTRRPTSNRPREPRQPPDGEKENQVKLSNLHYEINEEMLANIFNGFQLTKLVVKYDKSGRSTGEAVVAFEKSIDADRAIDMFDGKTAKDQEIRVEPYGYFTVDPPPRSGATGSSLLSRLGAKVHSDPPPSGPRSKQSSRPRKQTKPANIKSKPAPKDSDSQDKELDDFMKKPGSNNVNTQDTEMS
ncbi:hypothetical protein E3P92_00387 [Wallemia ichthyophaga]|nr:hypothetical protein E3P92_00387 [Wallemia ichthyophaga]